MGLLTTLKRALFGDTSEPDLAPREETRQLEGWFERVGQERCYSIPMGHQAVTLLAFETRSTEFLGRCFLDGQPLRVSWERFESSTVYSSTTETHFTWPQQEEVPCTELVRALERKAPFSQAGAVDVETPPAPTISEYQETFVSGNTAAISNTAPSCNQ